MGPRYQAEHLTGDASPDGIGRRTLFDAGGAKAVLFTFAPGQGLKEHSTARPAILHVLEGEGVFGLGAETIPARPGTWVRMGPDLVHRVEASTRLVMLLTLLPES